MEEFNGSRKQGAMATNPAVQERTGGMNFPLRGKIMPNGVRYRDQNGAKQTLVDVFLYDYYPSIANVPLAHTKMNQNNGEEWTPEPGDLVLVQFIAGNLKDPIITGYLAPADNEVEATALEAPAGKRRYHLRCNKTDIKIDKDGNRATTVTGNDTQHTTVDQALTVDGKRTTIIEGNDDTTITSGDLTVTVSAGKCTVHIAGKTAWTSDGTIELDGGSGSPKGVVQGDCLCTYSGKPHPMISTTVKSSL